MKKNEYNLSIQNQKDIVVDNSKNVRPKCLSTTALFVLICILFVCFLTLFSCDNLDYVTDIFGGDNGNNNINNIIDNNQDNSDSNEENKTDNNAPSTDDLIYTVTFDSNGGSEVENQKVKHAYKVSVPEDPTKEGHTFLGWYCGDEKWSFIGYVVTEDITLTAMWQKNTYLVDIYSPTIGEHNEEYYVYGSHISFNITYCPVGYYYEGLYTEDGKKWDLENDTVTEDLFLTVKYEKLSFTVTFDTLGYGDVPSQTVLYGEKVIEPENPIGKSQFLYWSLNEESWNFETDCVYTDINLKAVYSFLMGSLEYAPGTVLRMATGYNSAKTGISFTGDSGIGEGITLADGVTYHVGDLKPTWVEVQNVLKVKFEDKYTGKKTSEEFPYWEQQLDQVDMVSGTAANLSEAGTAGKLINLADYLDDMPNFKKYLNDNPIVLLSISSVNADGEVGGIYFSPYFDGVNDIERMPLMRTDWVVKLLDGEGDFSAEASHNLEAAVYTPYMPTSGKIEVDVVKLDASGTEKVTKDYDKAGNIIAKMNAALAAGTVSGVQAVNMLRDYIDEAYNGYYGTARSNLFVGQNAAWDADELVALLRCVVANPQTLNGTDNVEGIFSREDNNNQRRVDMMRFVGTLFGVRGLESRQDYLYVGADGLLHDARQEEATYVAIERMNALAQEGLISSSFIGEQSNKTETYLKNDSGFMHYDYNQTQTIYNETALQDGEKYMAVIIPVARWNDGTGEIFMRFTESWRSVKTDGWAISAAGVEGNTDKLHAALALIDYAYSEKGQILMSYGPDAFIETKADGSYLTFDFNGKQMPVISEESYTFLWNSTANPGNYTDYARIYLGSTLSFVKSQAFEYQCTHDVGKEGAANVSNAIKYGIIKHPELAITDNPWYSIVPTTLPNTKVENDEISKLTELGSSGKFSQNKDKINILINIIVGGYSGEGLDSRSAVLNTVKTTYGGETYLAYKQDAYDRLIEYYESLSK